jgi:Kef-type K+ transport system membrane component KefB
VFYFFRELTTAVAMLRSKMIFAYAGSVVATVAIFLWICFLGRSLPGSAASTSLSSSIQHVPMPQSLTHVLLAVVVVIVAARGVGAIFKRLNQPPVMGEVLAGILLGPSFFGLFAPASSSFLFPPQVAPHLAVISQIGVILYMFLVGLELDTDLLRQRTQSSIAISHASIVVPFLLGAALALILYPSFSLRNVSFVVFALFLSVSMSVTAFPVLARILTDLGIQKSRLGVLALACAAVDDVSAWCLLALVVSVIRAHPDRVLLTVALTAAFNLVVLLAVRRGALWLVGKQVAAGKTTRDMFAIVCVTLLLAGLTTEQIGIHAVFGAFLIGTVIPCESALARDIREKCEDLAVVLLLPVFFAFTGLRTQVGLLKEPRHWLICILIILVASLGKFGGGYAAARFTGSDWREAASLGVLLNTRGLMELIVLNMGLDLGVLSPTLFTMFVLMAVTTTLATTPVLQRIVRFDSSSEATVERASAATFR